MKKILTVCAICTLSFLKAFSQDDPTPIGYKLKPNASVIKVYQDKDGEPDLTQFNKWTYGYFFETDETKKIKDVEYIKITIPSGYKWDAAAKRYTPEPHFTTPVPWPQSGVYVDSDDFNSWLWIKKSDFDTYKKNYYPRFPFQFVLSGLTVPFKYRTPTGPQTSSVLAGDLNVGTFLGVRLPFGDQGGLSVGGFFGLEALSQNASNNSNITDKTTQSMTGFDRGAGLVFDWQKKFQIGVVMGYDHGTGDLSKTYLYQDKRWFALSLNYKFLDFLTSKSDNKQGASSTAPSPAH